MIPKNLHELNNLQVARALRDLEPTEKQVIVLRFGLGGQAPLTLSGASDAIGVPREEIRRIELRAMEKLGWVNLVG